MKTTDELEHMIEENPDIIKCITKNTKSAKILLNHLIEENGLNNAKLGKELGMSNYIYEITNLSSKKQPSRKKLLSILIYLQVDLETINNILQGFGYSKIYVQVAFDAAIYHCVINEYTLEETNDFLLNSGFKIQL